jgi:hypothetical protein
VLDRVYVEGGFAVFPVLTALGSLGVVLEQPIGARWSVHLAAGASGIFDVSEHSCERADGPDCWDQFDERFVYARIGVAIRWSVDTPAEPRQRKLALDVGLWRGEARYRAGTRLRDRDRFMTPMAGLTYLFL